MTTPRQLLPDSLLAGIPTPLRDELLAIYQEILRNFRDGRWEPSELNGGKFCEIVYTILKGYLDGSFPSKASKPANMLDACRALESQSGSAHPRSVRIQIPRVLMALYEIRNNRGVGHIGGDVNPNHMDATAVLSMSKWTMAELVRLFHKVEPAIAARMVDAIVERELPVIWAVNGKQRVLDTDLSMKEKMLLILYQNQDIVPEDSVRDWIEHSNGSVLRRDIIRPAHKEKLIEYDEASTTIQISPKGVKFVEESPRLNRHVRG